MPKPLSFKPQALRDLAEIDGADGWWQALGAAAGFRLAPSDGSLPTGWLQLTISLQAPRNAFRVPTVTFDDGTGFKPLQGVMPHRLGDGRLRVMIHVPPQAIALAMGAPVAQGPFRLGPVEARPMHRPIAGMRLALSLGQHWLREPRQGLQAARSLGSALRLSGRAGLRQAIGRAMLERDPVKVPPTAQDAERYQRWSAEQETLAPFLASGAPARRISLLLPVSRGQTAQLSATLDSVMAQQGVELECRIGFAPDAEEFTLGPDRYRRIGPTSSRLGTAERGAMLAALAAGATGDLLMVLDPGDRLAPDALFTLATVAGADIVHGDEDRIGQGGQRHSPFLKPEWSPEMLEAFNYFGRPTVLDREAAEQAGGFAAKAGAAAEWDLHLRMVARSAKVVRIPRILCHRPADGRTERPAADLAEAAEMRAAIAAHWRRVGIDATIATQPDGTQRSTWALAEPPLVSVIIPNRDKPKLLEQCLRGLLDETNYPRMEVIVVDSGSTDPETLDLYARLEAEGRIRVLPFHLPFNYSAACNAGARAASGELLLFLNNDIAVTCPDWLEEMVRYAQRPGVGIVGTMLVYPDGRLQHAGVTIGMHLCGLLFRLAPEAEWGPFGSPLIPRTLSAIMGACQMVRREVFAVIGGFDETYAMANSDVALCLAARAAGWRTAYTPFARLIHHEGASRGHHNPPEDMTRTAIDIRRFGYREDPFFHPALDADSNIPRLRFGQELGNAACLQRDLRRHGAGLAAPVPLDLYNDAEVIEALGLPASMVFWTPEPAAAIHDIWSAARWCLDLLRRRADLRQRFPDALSAGATGAFARWVMGDGARELALPDSALGPIGLALAGDLSAQARQAVLVRRGLQEDLALAFLPPGRIGLLTFLLRREQDPLRLEEAWWLALECAEDPARELARSYRFNPGWQALFPDGLTVFGRERMAAWFRATYRSEAGWTDPAAWPETLTPAEQIRLGWNSRSHWREHHPAPFDSPGAAYALLGWLAGPEAGLTAPERAWVAAQPAEALAEALAVPGLNVVGHLCYPSGLRTSTLSIIEGLRQVGYDLSLRDVPVDATNDLPRHAEFDGLELHDVTLLHIQPEPFFHQAFARSGLQPRRQRTHRIGYWYWELDSVPESWSPAVAEADELWTATRFVGDALRSRFDIPVFEFMPGLELPVFTRRSPQHFGIPPGRFTFLFTFHMMSIMERKNPLGLVRAFLQAFTAEEPVTLVLKTSYGEKHPALIAELHAAAAASGGRILIIDRVFSADETIALMDACDCYISLHRSEGLGLTMAEAMLLAKPVIGTRYSGNLDFMDDQNSLLVDYRLVEIERPVPPYEAGSRWAEPSEAHAALQMRRVWEDRNFARELGARAQVQLRNSLSMRAAGQRMADRLAVIRAARRARQAPIG
ncbi:glycosyltransferase [Belnapia rosea]|uniref:Glycosyltransferase, GT2 family n=1 Tax=Belnapia rosea TaxID=938405 RepID=A0A1G6KKZ5_9PROT|nr:glycosyltransferase [Belnapia rosea]SDC31501.1 Glycosyltransferase, GT2 family [Belnapia rosea]